MRNLDNCHQILKLNFKTGKYFKLNLINIFTFKTRLIFHLFNKTGLCLKNRILRNLNYYNKTLKMRIVSNLI